MLSLRFSDFCDVIYFLIVDDNNGMVDREKVRGELDEMLRTDPAIAGQTPLLELFA